MIITDKEMTIVRTYAKAIAAALRDEEAFDLAQLLDLIMEDDRLHRSARDVLMMLFEVFV